MLLKLTSTLNVTLYIAVPYQVALLLHSWADFSETAIKYKGFVFLFIISLS